MTMMLSESSRYFSICFDLQNLVEMFADFLHLDITEDHALARHLEIRCALVGVSLRLVLHVCATRHRVGGELIRKASRAERPVCSVCSSSGVSRSFLR